MRRAGILALVLAALPAVVLVLGLGWYRCPILAATGVPCPGCGMTRGAAALLRLDFAGAWQSHPMIYPLLILLGWWGLRYLLGRLTYRESLFTGCVFAAATVLCWFVRYGSTFLI